MPLCLLGISREQDANRDSPEVRWLTHGRLAAALVSIPGGQGRDSAAIGNPEAPLDPLRQGRLLQAIHRRIDILPARYGTVLPEEEDVRTLLARRQNEFLDTLRRLKATAEMGLRIRVKERPSPRDSVAGCAQQPAAIARLPESSRTLAPPPSLIAGQQYLAGRRDFYARRDRIADATQSLAQDCVRRFAGMYRRWCQLSAAEPTTLRLSFLVGREQVADFQARVEGLPDLFPGARFVLLGPLPPYTFV